MAGDAMSYTAGSYAWETWETLPVAILPVCSKLRSPCAKQPSLCHAAASVMWNLMGTSIVIAISDTIPCTIAQMDKFGIGHRTRSAILHNSHFCRMSDWSLLRFVEIELCCCPSLCVLVYRNAIIALLFAMLYLHTPANMGLRA